MRRKGPRLVSQTHNFFLSKYQNFCKLWKDWKSDTILWQTKQLNKSFAKQLKQIPWAFCKFEEALTINAWKNLSKIMWNAAKPCKLIYTLLKTEIARLSGNFNSRILIKNESSYVENLRLFQQHAIFYRKTFSKTKQNLYNVRCKKVWSSLTKSIFLDVWSLKNFYAQYRLRSSPICLSCKTLYWRTKGEKFFGKA